jgi:uncharacterized protein YcfJ
MKRISTSLLALAITAVTGSSIASAQGYGNDYRNENNRQRSDIAQVIRVERINNGYGAYERQECWNEQSRDYDNGYYRDNDGRLYRGDNSNNKSGAVIGAIVGGALGNQAGKGDGRKAATVAGAVIGATIGNKVQRDNNQYEYRDDSNGTVRRCRTVYDDNNNSRYGNYDAYDVTYRYAGQTYHATTDYRPGRTIRVLVNVRLEDRNQRYGNR